MEKRFLVAHFCIRHASHSLHYLLGVPKFTANLNCICLSIYLRYKYLIRCTTDLRQILGHSVHDFFMTKKCIRFVYQIFFNEPTIVLNIDLTIFYVRECRKKALSFIGPATKRGKRRATKKKNFF